MQFQVGDRVVHPLHGVGTVKSITRQRFAGKKALPYYEVVTGDLTVWVPVDTGGLVRLRAIAAKASLVECRRLLMSDPVPLDRNYRLRQIEISTRVKDGSLPARCAMVRDLRAQSWSRSLSEGEDAMLKRISNAVRDEWAAAEGIAVDSALREIEACIETSRLAWTSDNKVASKKVEVQ